MPMRYLYLGNNEVGRDVLSWLRDQHDELVGLVVHPIDKGRYVEELQQLSGLADNRIFNAADLRDPSVIDAIRALRADAAVSVYFGYILRRELLDIFPDGVINVHPSLLPFGKGAFPNVWSIVDETPAGVTIHYIDAGIDSGDIIAQREVKVLPEDTGATLYSRLQEASVDLFRSTWPSFRDGLAGRQPQQPGGTTHRLADVAAIDRIDLEKSYAARELINIIRARTFPPFNGAYFEVDSRRYFLRLEITPQDP